MPETFEAEKSEAFERGLLEKVITIKPIMLEGEEELEDVIREIMEGNIVILRYNSYAKRQPDKFMEALRKLTNLIKEEGGDAVMIDVKEFPPLLIVPRFVEVWRSPRGGLEAGP